MAADLFFVSLVDLPPFLLAGETDGVGLEISTSFDPSGNHGFIRP
jgi:hypothetical protein